MDESFKFFWARIKVFDVFDPESLIRELEGICVEADGKHNVIRENGVYTFTCNMESMWRVYVYIEHGTVELCVRGSGVKFNVPEIELLVHYFERGIPIVDVSVTNPLKLSTSILTETFTIKLYVDRPKVEILLEYDLKKPIL